ncbi:acyl carrier protein [Halorhodospira halophila]|uniref:Carrier domain-containing protein n=1 Tax=Halorhodospira halophila (strain DSM 244 / SL1) TaxID=349124 RepID=A1WXC4_HALHL|nr:phosphopantetheine-binding protein [Halorhodospira halophila]ABM62336.1 conserved hypothetical protein [Halorhodospira halophila SL1]MBK1730063.1 acyl carrier protein [Halorhodospira halophila]
MSSIEEVKGILDATLSLGGRAKRFDRDTALLGALPELDSMAVVSVLTACEERFGFIIEDDEVSGETFATLGSLADFVDGKINEL